MWPSVVLFVLDPTDPMRDEATSVDQQLADATAKLNFIRKRQAEYPQAEAVPPQLRARERQLEQEIARLTPRPAAPRPNPFGQRGCIDPTDFFDRDELLRRIFEELGKGGSISLLGPREIGKSSLLAMIAHQGPQRLGLPPDAFLHIDMQIIRDEGEFFDALCDELAISPTQRGYHLARRLRGKRYILCLDEIEKMRNRERFSGEERKELRGLADRASAPLTLVIASSQPLDQLFPDTDGSTSPLANICPPIDVLPFTPEVARAFIATRLQPTGVRFAPAEVEHLLWQSGGHPARLQQAAADLYRRYTEGSR